jgi:hypothetical protein
MGLNGRYQISSQIQRDTYARSREMMTKLQAGMVIEHIHG